MKIINLGHALALAGVLSLGAALSLDVQAAEYKPKAEVKSLHQSALSGVAGKTVIIKHFTLPAGFVGGKHFHPADVFVYVLELSFGTSLCRWWGCRSWTPLKEKGPNFSEP